jgi:hypothetical protein
VRRVLVGCLVLIAAACARTDSEAENAEPAQCSPGVPTPISERAAKEAFVAEGIELRRAECIGDELMLLSNISDAVPYEREGSIMASQGHILCSLYDVDETRGRIRRYVWRNDPDPTYVEVLNVSCAVFPERRAHTDAVERALRHLPGVSSLPSVVPSEDAIRDY